MTMATTTTISKHMKIMKKIFNYLLMAVLTVGLSLAVTSCKDDDNSENNGTEQQGGDSAEDVMSLADDQLADLICQWCDVQSYDLSGSAWRTKTYDVTEGVVMDESRPTVRSVEVGTIEGADAYAARALYALGIDNQSPAGFSFSDAEVGTVSYKHGGGSDANVLATVDVDVKQLPGLTRMQLVKQLSENAGGGEPYYQMGDVVSYTVKRQTRYAICVSYHNKNQKATFITLNDQKLHTKGKFNWRNVGLDTVYNDKMASAQALYSWMSNIVFNEERLGRLREYLGEVADLSEEQINMVVPATEAQRHRFLYNLEQPLNHVLWVNQPHEASEQVGIQAGSMVAMNYLFRDHDPEEGGIAWSAPRGNLLANKLRWSEHVLSSWDHWVPYLIAVKEKDAEDWRRRLNAMRPLSTLDTKHFKWEEVGTFELTKKLEENEKLRSDYSYSPRVFYVFLVATYWQHELARGLFNRQYKFLFDFTYIWKNSDFEAGAAAGSYVDLDNPDDYWDRANITSTEISFTDNGKRNTDYKDVYIQRSIQ